MRLPRLALVYIILATPSLATVSQVLNMYVYYIIPTVARMNLFGPCIGNTERGCAAEKKLLLDPPPQIYGTGGDQLGGLTY